MTNNPTNLEYHNMQIQKKKMLQSIESLTGFVNSTVYVTYTSIYSDENLTLVDFDCYVNGDDEIIVDLYDIEVTLSLTFLKQLKKNLDCEDIIVINKQTLQIVPQEYIMMDECI